MGHGKTKQITRAHATKVARQILSQLSGDLEAIKVVISVARLLAKRPHRRR